MVVVVGEISEGAQLRAMEVAARLLCGYHGRSRCASCHSRSSSRLQPLQAKSWLEKEGFKCRKMGLVSIDGRV